MGTSWWLRLSVFINSGSPAGATCSQNIIPGVFPTVLQVAPPGFQVGSPADGGGILAAENRSQQDEEITHKHSLVVRPLKPDLRRPDV